MTVIFVLVKVPHGLSALVGVLAVATFILGACIGYKMLDNADEI
jgi:hypothetical protein